MIESAKSSFEMEWAAEGRRSRLSGLTGTAPTLCSGDGCFTR
jgi:hypothetical protein